jgi:hypothetical protein
MDTAVEEPPVSSGSYTCVFLGLDRNFDVDDNINMTTHSSLQFLLSASIPSCSQSVLLLACGPDILPAAIPTSSSTCTYSIPRR